MSHVKVVHASHPLNLMTLSAWEFSVNRLAPLPFLVVVFNEWTYGYTVCFLLPGILPRHLLGIARTLSIGWTCRYTPCSFLPGILRHARVHRRCGRCGSSTPAKRYPYMRLGEKVQVLPSFHEVSVSITSLLIQLPIWWYGCWHSLPPHLMPPSLGFVSTLDFSELYGKVQEIPQTEKTPFYPRSP